MNLDGGMMNLDARQWPLVESCDPSMTRGLYVTWAQKDPRTDRWYVVWAAHIEDAAISVMAEQVKRERRFIGKEPDLAIMDAKGGRARVDKERDEDWFVRFRQLGLDYVPNDEPAPLEAIASESAAPVTLSGASTRAKPSLAPNAYQSPSSLQPASSSICLTVSVRFSGLLTSPAQTSGS
jgi:hypothetical protein